MQISATTMAEAAPHLKGRLKSVSPCLLLDDGIKSVEYYRDVPGVHFDCYGGEPACVVIFLRDSIEMLSS